ncbi:MAG: ATP-binding cassette domain-containing protein [Candidatus Thermoplasmatota archaeon]
MIEGASLAEIKFLLIISVAVNEISFEVEEGEIFGFLEPNGAGKTTIKMLTCQIYQEMEKQKFLIMI